ncbi:penicillin-binding transpeptidase domain-containing protein [Lachnoclostridium sp. Marseille-P6806]|uniref:penicillin-binding transpeptidase domain-containing protein n=1 Tax=Lachnoclostridium sp. Marseille-P6806 TaxID=2364793 RepID=UPI001F5E65B4|nr:penicillin-binding transpeptidase domain-containing protein [Lachnoclostridium sp. Marseille-P6806]
MPERIEFLKKHAAAFFRNAGIRIWILVVLFVMMSAGLIYRLFQLQIVDGQEYLDNFQLRIRKEITISGTRGNIYDRNGNILAYNELAYAVTIRDTYAGEGRSRKLNSTISRVIDIIEENGDAVSTDFEIAADSRGAYRFDVTGAALLRFLADVYGHSSTDDLKYEEKTKTPDEIVRHLAENYGIGEYAEPGNSKSKFFPGKGYTDDPAKLLKMIIVRYNLGLNSYQKYLSTTIAFNVSENTAADILESADTLQGVSIEDDTIRKYTDSRYFAHILGYTGKISTEELTALQMENPDLDYDQTDIVGKSGIEKALEAKLQGRKGSETVYVDNRGTVLETTNRIDPSAGNDVYLTIDKDLTEAAYDILEARLANILLAKLRNVKEYNAGENASSADIILPIYDVYHAVFNNNIISISHLSAPDAKETERAVQAAFDVYLSELWDKMEEELYQSRTPYEDLPREYQIYQSYMVQHLYDSGILNRNLVDASDQTYIDWTTNETISMTEFLDYAISAGWVDVSGLSLESRYSDSRKVFDAVFARLKSNLSADSGFIRRVYRYLLLNDRISGEQVCRLLLEQEIVKLSPAEEAQFESGALSAYQFMYNRIMNLDLTPAQLSLDPYSGSMVITDVNTGDVLAMVTYPGYDNNRMSNGVDAVYYESLRQDLSSPLFNYATQQRTAPGSTFKMVTATAGLMEGVIDLSSTITCTGVFTKIGNPMPKCWVYPGSHGTLNVTGAIRDSCNDFFYEVGWRLSQRSGAGEDSYDSAAGIAKLAQYAGLYGLSDSSGVEIDEADPQISGEDAVRSAIGQGNSGYTTAQLARYVTAVANSGTVYDLTLLDRVTDPDGNVVLENNAEIRNIISMDPAYWSAIHLGMREVVESKIYYKDLGVSVAGKTGTAQESTSRPNHALFVCYAPYEKPEIAVAARIANGYTSDYAAQLTRDVLRYYFGLGDRASLVTTDTVLTGTVGGD